jgi:hypothetical protein
MRPVPRFTTGPFLSASHMIEDLALSFYSMYLLSEAIESQLRIEADLTTALEQEDEEAISQCRIDLRLIETAYEFSLISETNNDIQ